MNTQSDERANRKRLLRMVMLAVLAWGSMLALGSLLFGYDRNTGDIAYAPNLWRGLIMEGCVLIFVGSWWLLTRSASDGTGQKRV